MLLKLTLIIFFALVFVTPQSFASVKIPFLALAIVLICANVYLRKYTLRTTSVLYYYLVFSALVLVWGLIGTLRGNPVQAVFEAILVYLIYLWIYALLVVYLSNQEYQRLLYPFFAFVAVAISAFCFYMLADYFLRLNWLPSAIREEMYLQIGVHEGYVQMNNINIAMFSFLLPFLIGYLLLKESPVRYWEFALVALIISAAVIASRRVILLLCVLSPAITLVTYYLTGGGVEKVAKRTGYAYLLLILLATGLLVTLNTIDQAAMESFVNRITDAVRLSEDSVRYQQHIAMMNALNEFPILGSGFGGLTEIIRSSERPWSYELTYSRLFFNSGTVGLMLMILFFVSYLILVLQRVKEEVQYRQVYVSMLVGYFCVLLAAISNPYLNSFDFVFAFSIVPLILNSRFLKHTFSGVSE